MLKAFTSRLLKSARYLLRVKQNQVISETPLPDHSTPAMSSKNLIWVDLEMTGLDVERDTVLEMACIITDGSLNVIAKGPDIIVHQPDSVLDGMGEWCTEHHGKSGLTAACRSSTTSLEDTEKQMLAFVQTHTRPGECVLAGNTIHMDKRFLDKYMPRFTAHLHYRLVDVSTVKELCRRWYPAEFKKAPRKKVAHRALEDILESIEELRYYKATIFK